MARADLLYRLVQSGMSDDKSTFRKVVEAVIAEERAKQHTVLAEKLNELLTSLPADRPADLPAERPVPRGGASMPDRRMDSLFHEVMPGRKLSDLILPDEVQQICEAVIQEQHRTDLLRSYNLEPRNRILLIGPPGNGKTSLAEAIAEALMVPLLVVRYENVVGTFLGETAGRLKKVFEQASAQRCVFFFDEFETLGKERGDVHETGEIKRVVSSLLMQIDNLPSHVVVIGATNHAELLDRAVWRRFQIRMILPGPTEPSLAEWFERFERRINISLGYASAVLAKSLMGANFAETEEFGAAVLRQYVLGQPDADMKDIVSQNIRNWTARTVSMTQHDELEMKA
ncbi:MAG: ATP-binding protein [Desulfovibrionaceae bacterium]|nr:ATP-binding protein [Desulfovibrionaceae bacterium]